MIKILINIVFFSRIQYSIYMIKIVYAGNDLMFDSVFLSCLSMARRTKEGLHVYFLTMDFSNKDPKFKPFRQDQADKINEVILKYHNEFKFEIIDTTEKYNLYLKDNKNEKPAYSPYCTLRLLVDEYDVFSGKVIYLDCDTMLCGDISMMYSIDMENLEFRACHDYMGRFWIKKDYINSGTLLLNMDVIRETGLLKKCCKLVREKRMYFTDQTALYKCKTKFAFYPDDEFRFNEQREIKENTIVKHFCKGIQYLPYFYVYNIKQTNVEKVHSFLKIHNFDEDYDIYFKEIKGV